MDSDAGIKRKVKEGERKVRLEGDDRGKCNEIEQSRGSDTRKLQNEGSSEIIRIGNNLLKNLNFKDCRFEGPDFLRVPCGLYNLSISR